MRAHTGDVVYLEQSERMTPQMKERLRVELDELAEMTGVTTVLLPYGMKATVAAAEHAHGKPTAGFFV